MSFIKSALFGNSGNYQLFGVDIAYKKDDTDTSSSLEGAGTLSNLAAKILENKAFRLLTQGYLHVNLHEMGHALAAKLFLKGKPEVTIQTGSCTGYTELLPGYADLAPWKKTLIDAAGPLANIAFSSGEMIAAAALKNYPPVSLTLAASGAIWIAGELFYAAVASQKEPTPPPTVRNYNSPPATGPEEDDFYNIAQRGKTHLAAAATALLTTVGLGLLAAAQFF